MLIYITTKPSIVIKRQLFFFDLTKGFDSDYHKNMKKVKK